MADLDLVSIDRSSAHVHVFTRQALTWSGLQQELGYFDSRWLFRGQGSASWPVRCHLDRKRGSREPIDAERFVLGEFKRRAHLFLTTNREPETTLEWLALIQHHGGPTRLIDFTRSPLVAVFFALDEAPLDPDENCTVWGISEDAAHRRAIERIRAVDPEFSWLLEHHDIGPAVDARLLATPAQRFVAPVQPTRVNARMALQQGLFMCLGDPGSDLIANLVAEGIEEPPLQIVKVQFPRAIRPHALWALRRLGITREALFPGLDGFAASLIDQLAAKPSFHEALIAKLQLPKQWPGGNTDAADEPESEANAKTSTQPP